MSCGFESKKCAISLFLGWIWVLLRFHLSLPLLYIHTDIHVTREKDKAGKLTSLTSDRGVREGWVQEGLGQAHILILMPYTATSCWDNPSLFHSHSTGGIDLERLFCDYFRWLLRQCLFSSDQSFLPIKFTTGDSLRKGWVRRFLSFLVGGGEAWLPCRLQEAVRATVKSIFLTSSSD